MNLLEMLGGSLTEETSVNNIAKKSGGSKAQILKLIAFALPLLLTYLTRNAKKEEGARSLANALGQHKNTNSIATQIEDADTDDGEKILKHILGRDEDAVTNNLAKQTGMSQSQVMSALDAILPGVMSGISASATQAGKKKKAGLDLSDGLDLTDIMGMFGGSSSKSNGFGLESLLGLGGGATPKKKKEKTSSSSASKDELEKAKYEAELAKAKAEKAKAEAELAKLQLEQEKAKKGTTKKSIGSSASKKSSSGNAGLESIMGQLLGGSKPTAKKSTMDGSDLLSMLSGLM